MAEDMCANEACGCELGSVETVERDGKEYCSEFCATSEAISLEECQCGHAECI